APTPRRRPRGGAPDRRLRTPRRRRTGPCNGLWQAARPRPLRARAPCPSARRCSRGRTTPGAGRAPRGGGVPAPRGSRAATVDVAPECANRKDEPVEVVVDVEVAREAGAGEPRLVPAAVGELRADEPVEATRDRIAMLAGRVEGEERPGCLRRRRLALSTPGPVDVRAKVFAPAAVVVLDTLEPGDRAPDGLVVGRDPGLDQRRHRRTRAVDEVRSPAAEP